MKKSLLLISFLIASITAIIFLSEAKNNNSVSELKSDSLIVKEKKLNNVSTLKVKDTTGEDVFLSDYKGKVLLIVNVASECGYTPQYKGLQELYEKYKNDGFEILAFPCNDFGGQEPGSNEDIKNFCSMNYGVTFKLFDKIKILGEDKEKLYSVLTDNDVTGTTDVKWNFEKFLISKTGDIVSRYPSKIKPLSEELLTSIEAELRK